jgi:4-amino-4-deoxy-L-arabinose transferase-like glycosyltransferase
MTTEGIVIEIGTRRPGDDRAARETTDDKIPRLAWVIAAVFVAVELVVSDRYGFQQDELYFLVASHHLAFGYVDQPPLAVLLARGTDIFGVNPTAIRILPALAGGAIVLIAARLAGLFGAGAGAAGATGLRSGRTIAALGMATSPVLLSATHIGNTTPYDLLAWAVVLLCVAMAVLRDRPRWWLGAGAAAGAGLENEYLITLLIGALVAGILVTSAHRRVLTTPWPWLGGVIALAIWAPNLAWQFANGWPQLTMASALHAQNTSAANYIAGLPAQLLYAGVLGVPLVIAGFIRLYRTPELRFLGIAATLVAAYVLAWVPGKVYYCDGMLPAVIAAGSVSAERWLASAARARPRQGLIVAGLVLSAVIIVPNTLPVLPVAALHTVPPDKTVNDSVGWPQLTAAVAAQDAALTRAGEAPASIYTAAYAEAGALDLYGGPYHLPPVVSAHNSFWTWGPGDASDTTVLVVDALGQLSPHFASCRQLTVFNPPDQVQSDWNDIPISVCTGPAGSWRALWPYLKHYD